ncbi:MAG: amidohydrolase family protein [Proteobacteria bacterium]|nr:amidohydrolase family protein [Pseudomonadota bacterium]
MKTLPLTTITFLLTACASLTSTQPPLSDTHLHFNWDQEELVSAEEAVNILKKHNIDLAVVTATPSANAVKLRRVGGDWILPIFSPYVDMDARYGWFNRPDVIDKTRAALQSGEFFGIGELHLMVGLGPRRDNKVFTGLLALAEEFAVPMLIHTEAQSYRYLEAVCRKYPKVRFLWAHAGGLLGAGHSEKLLQSCPNVWIELSARDPEHYGSFLTKDDRIPSDWLRVFKMFPDRFMTGTDPVWKAHELHRWDRADEGWLHYGEFIKFHRHWLAQLPADIERKIRLTNAKNFWLGSK